MATIRKTGSSYQIRVSSGSDSNGKQVMRTLTWKPDPGMTENQIKKELTKKAVNFEHEVKDGLAGGCNIKLSDFSIKWMSDYAEVQLKPNTVELYKNLLLRILPALGNYRLDKIKPLHIIEFYNNVSKDGQNRNTGGKLSPKTIRHHHALLNIMFETAVKWQLLSVNPCSRVDAPKLKKKEARYLEPKDIKKLIECLEHESIMYRTIYLLLLYTGMRRGELAGLEWSDINYAEKEIHIQRSSIYLNNQGVISQTPKTETSARVISVPEDVCSMLRVYRVWQMEEQLKLGDKWVDSKRIFTNWNGQILNPQLITKRLSLIVKKYGLPKITPHSLRHTHASLLISQHVDIATVSERLGHADKSTTLNIYTHAFHSSDTAAAESIGDAMNNIKRERA